MNDDPTNRDPTLEVIDALDHPHGGRILRVRMTAGDPPPLGTLRRASLRAVSPEGVERTARILGFPVTGGRASDARFRQTRRLDLLVEEEGEGPRISAAWTLQPGSPSGGGPEVP